MVELVLGSLSFRSCRNLESVEILSTIRYWGAATFAGCVALQSVYVAATVPSLTDVPFATYNYCGSLEVSSMDDLFPNWSNVTSIGGEAFARCTNLIQAIILPRVTTIWHLPFYQSGIRNATIGTFGQELVLVHNVFSRCANLVSVEILSTITSWGSNTFLERFYLRTVYIGATSPTLTVVPEGTYGYCYRLVASSMDDLFPNWGIVTGIGSGAFIRARNVPLSNESLPYSRTWEAQRLNVHLSSPLPLVPLGKVLLSDMLLFVVASSYISGRWLLTPPSSRGAQQHLPIARLCSLSTLPQQLPP